MAKPIRDEDVEAEIARLEACDAVKLGRRDRHLRNRRREYMYNLRSLEKRGMELMQEGFTLESLDEMYSDPEESWA